MSQPSLQLDLLTSGKGFNVIGVQSSPRESLSFEPKIVDRLWLLDDPSQSEKLFLKVGYAFRPLPVVLSL